MLTMSFVSTSIYLSTLPTPLFLFSSLKKIESRKLFTSKTMCLSLSLTFCFIFMFSVSPTSISCAAKDTLVASDYLLDGQTLVSSGQRFEFGFFSPGNSSHRYLGIWYRNLPLTVVWVANRNEPATYSNCKLELDSAGKLSLYNLTDLIWSIYPKKRATNPVLQILDSGNLVLRDGKGVDHSRRHLWESFDYPCNTLLPKMKLGWNLKTGLSLNMTSWKSNADPSTGEFTLSLEHSESHQLVLHNGWEKEYRWGPWDGVTFSGIKELKSNPIFKPIFTSNSKEVSYTFKVYDTSIPLRLFVNDLGFAQYLVWSNYSNKWVTLLPLQSDNCDRYGVCGPYGICYRDDPNCQCLNGFAPKSPLEWNLMDWSSGCTRKWELNCGDGDGFLKYEGLKLPDSSHFLTNKNFNPMDCQAECLNNCSCMAFTTLDIYGNGSNCVMWFGDLIDMRHFPRGREEIYIRMAQADIDSIAYVKRMKKAKRIAIISVSTIFGMFLFGVIGWSILHIMRVLRRGFGEGIAVSDFEGERPEETPELPYFNMVTISNATENFSPANKIGQGGFGTVYKGVLSDGQEIAVKRLSRYSCQGLQEFKNEIVLIANLQHRNLVRLLGCCVQGEERMLIYEYLPNKSLDYFLFDETKRRLLTWKKRFNIVVGIARGLLYLHQDSRLRIIHRDLKTSNILLDGEMVPKISDFGLARIIGCDQTEEMTKRIIGTYGYMSPEYALCGHFSVKSDVFSFGVLVLEIISGKRNWRFCHPDHDLNLIGHAWKLWSEANPLELMDAQMEGSFLADEVIRCIQVGLLCVQPCAEDRPPMSHVVNILGHETSQVPQPKIPDFGTETSTMGIAAFSGEQNPYTANEVTDTVLDGR